MKTGRSKPRNHGPPTAAMFSLAGVSRSQTKPMQRPSRMSHAAQAAPRQNADWGVSLTRFAGCSPTPGHARLRTGRIRTKPGLRATVLMPAQDASVVPKFHRRIFLDVIALRSGPAISLVTPGRDRTL